MSDVLVQRLVKYFAPPLPWDLLFLDLCQLRDRSSLQSCAGWPWNSHSRGACWCTWFQKNGWCWPCGWKSSLCADCQQRGDVPFRCGVMRRWWWPWLTLAERNCTLTICVTCCLGHSNSSTYNRMVFLDLHFSLFWWVLSASLIATSFPFINRTSPITCHCSIAYELPFWHNSMKTA